MQTALKILCQEASMKLLHKRSPLTTFSGDQNYFAFPASLGLWIERATASVQPPNFIDSITLRFKVWMTVLFENAHHQANIILMKESRGGAKSLGGTKNRSLRSFRERERLVDLSFREFSRRREMLRRGLLGIGYAAYRMDRNG